MPDDATLLRRYAEEHAEDAFAELVRRHLDGVYSAALRRVGGDTHLAEDVAQQVFVALARKAKWLAGHPILTGWLYVTTRNEAANTVRRERRRKAREEEAQVMHDVFSKTAPDADWSCVAPVLDEAIDHLNENDRTAVLLRFIDRRGFAEIGAALRLTEDAARMRVERALEKLRAQLARRGIVSSSAALGVALANHATIAAPAGFAVTVTGAAMTGAVGAAASALSLLQIMSITKFALGVAGALAVISAVYETTQASTVTASLAALTRSEAALQAKRQDVEQRSATATRAQIELEKTLVAARSKIDAPPSAAASPAEPPADPMEKLLRSDSQFRQLFLQQGRTDLAHRYAPLFKSLNFTAAQTEQFLDSCINYLDQAVMRPGGLRALDYGPDAGAIQAVQSQLGDTVAQRFMDFERAVRAHDLSNTFVGSSYYTDEPFTPQQAEALTQIIAKASPEFRAGKDWEDTSVNWDDVLAQAESFLSPAQFAAARSIAGRMRMGQQMSLAEAEAEARAAAH